MRIVLNSDVLHTGKPIARGLPAHLATFCREAAGAGAILVIPRTTLLENQRQRERSMQETVTRIEAAVSLLRGHGIEVPPYDADAVVADPGLVDSLRETGIQVESYDPTHNDYRKAEERACLHLLPHPPEIKSDEMRDLVIWEIALRIARRDGRAILVSRDEVHVHERGDTEASEVGLLRARDFDAALDLLGRESPAGKLGRLIIETVWPALIAAGIELPTDVAAQKITDIEFAADEAGYVRGRLRFMSPTDLGVVSLGLTVAQVADGEIHVQVSDLTRDSSAVEPSTIELTVIGTLPIIASPQEDRLQELRRIIGEGI